MSIERTQEQQYQRITAVLKGWREQTALACAAYHEAKQSECWRLHHKTWKAFIEACGFTQEWARQLAMTGERMEEMTALLTSSPDATELHSHADLPTKVSNLTPGVRKVLDSIPLASQVGVLAQTKAAVPTVKEVKAVKAKVVEPAKIHEAELVLTDATELARTVPTEIAADWQRAEATAKDILHKLRDALHTIDDGLKCEDSIFADTTNGELSPLKAVIGHVNLHVKPHAVCAICHGLKSRKSCKLCKGRGYIGRHLWQTCVDSDTKALLAKMGGAK
jgi:hypothetical protein